MQSKPKHGRDDIPWAWVLISAYCTALACVAFSQLTGPEVAIALLRDYQTLVAGLATVAALFIAVEQLKRQAARDAIDAVRHHQAEMDALSLLTGKALALSHYAREVPARYGRDIPFDQLEWSRLQQEAHVSVLPAIRAAIEAIESHNAHLDRSHPFVLRSGYVEASQLAELRQSLAWASRQLSQAVSERQQVVSRLVEAAR